MITKLTHQQNPGLLLFLSVPVCQPAYALPPRLDQARFLRTHPSLRFSPGIGDRWLIIKSRLFDKVDNKHIRVYFPHVGVEIGVICVEADGYHGVQVGDDRHRMPALAGGSIRTFLD